MLKPKEAADIAEQHLKELSAPLTLEDIRLEEITPFGGNWRVTFSALSPVPAESVGNVHLLFHRRTYKVVEVDASTGQFVSLRNPAA